MCAIFGLIDYERVFTAHQREIILKVLSEECEVRGTDATGFAFNSGGKLKIFKRPFPAHEVSLNLRDDANVILGHTRMATQGDKQKNYNNHPFFGNAEAKFALAHNGILYNENLIRHDMAIPDSHIETDSYIAVQILEKMGELSEKSLTEMAEKVIGSFVFTILDEDNNSYFIKGDNPLALYHFEAGLYIYASTDLIYCAFVAMLNYAVKLEFIPKNNLSVLGNFKNNAALEKPVEPLRYYTSSQFEQFIAQARSDCKTVMDWGFYVFFCIAFFTGARKGEINALRWSDIDGKILHIRRSVTQKLKGGDVETAPKNKSSIRDLQLPVPLIAVLNEHKKRQQEVAQHLFSEDFLICGCNKPLRDTSIDKRNRKYAEAAGLPRIKIHEFRHSHVSLLANEGINIQEVARRLGHANVQETWNTYCHLYPREEERAVEVLNRIGTG